MENFEVNVQIRNIFRGGDDDYSHPHHDYDVSFNEMSAEDFAIAAIAGEEMTNEIQENRLSLFNEGVTSSFLDNYHIDGEVQNEDMADHTIIKSEGLSTFIMQFFFIC